MTGKKTWPQEPEIGIHKVYTYLMVFYVSWITRCISGKQTFFLKNIFLHLPKFCVFRQSKSYDFDQIILPICSNFIDSCEWCHYDKWISSFDISWNYNWLKKKLFIQTILMVSLVTSEKWWIKNIDVIYKEYDLHTSNKGKSSIMPLFMGSSYGIWWIRMLTILVLFSSSPWRHLCHYLTSETPKETCESFTKIHTPKQEYSGTKKPWHLIEN